MIAHDVYITANSFFESLDEFIRFAERIGNSIALIKVRLYMLILLESKERHTYIKNTISEVVAAFAVPWRLPLKYLNTNEISVIKVVNIVVNPEVNGTRKPVIKTPDSG